MLRINSLAQIVVVAFVALSIGVPHAFAQNLTKSGKVKIHVTPKQAYVFVDGDAIRDGSQTLVLSAGNHSIGVYNYGYAPETRTVEVVAGQTASLNVALRQAGDKVAGPFGDIELKGHPRAAVLLNGNTPPYFVGHVDEFDNNWIWHQWLLVKPGTYQMDVTQKGQTIWSGPVAVKAGQRVVVNLSHNGETTTKDFKPGLNLGPQPRFDAGLASALVPVAPVMAQLSASQTQTSCGQSATLDWKATDAADTSITNVGSVPASGDRTVSPTRTTTYQLIAKGPGGEAEQSATIDVNAQPAATLALSQPEVRYHKIGDKVVEQDSATLSWSTSNGNTVAIQPIGSVATSGSQSIEATPARTNAGPVDRDVTYTLNVTNACGGATARTATLHIVASIDPAPSVTLASVFYPTAYPALGRPKVGLVASQEEALAKAAATFTNSEQYAQQDKLTVVGHADVRGPEKYNMALSERRAELVKNYLISQGVPADKIEIRNEGKDQELDQATVNKLQSQDTQRPPKWMTSKKMATWLAYNRRVDIVLEPAGQESTEAYPNDTPDARTLWQRPVPDLKAIESASQGKPGSEQTQASNHGN